MRLCNECEAGQPVERKSDDSLALRCDRARWRALAGTKSHVWGTGTEPVADPLLAGRRWLTTLLDFYAAGLDAPADAPAALLRQLAPDARSFSADALIAAAAWRLLRFERRPDQALGVLGDDALFQGPTAD